MHDTSLASDDRAGVTVRPATRADVHAILGLIRDAELAVQGLVEHLDSVLVAERDARVIGAIGLEPRGADALLRSAVVAPSERGAGIGAVLYERIVARAQSGGIERLYLLTTTAAEYWARHGFTTTTRDAVPELVRLSPEFTGACPASATVMVRAI